MQKFNNHVFVFIEFLDEQDYPPQEYFRAKLQELRVLCLLCNAIDLAISKDHISVGGDGTSDHDILLGVQE